jgi:hypothetical protein
VVALQLGGWAGLMTPYCEKVYVLQNIYKGLGNGWILWHDLRVYYSEWPGTRRCFITIAFQFCFGICHQEGPRETELNGTHQLLAYAYDINILGENRYHTEEHRISIRF